MKENICLKKGHFIIIILAFIIMTFIYSVNNNKFNKNTSRLHSRVRNLNNKLEINDKKYKNKLKRILKDYNDKNDDNLKIDMIINKERNKMKRILRRNKIRNQRRNLNNRFIMKRDRKVVDDPIFPPESRLPRHIYKNNVYSHFNIPSRGHPDNYQILGVLTRNSDERTLQLFGRQKYPGSKTYEYFVAGNDLNGLQTKLPLKTRNDKEIYDKDAINIPQLNSSRGSFKVSLYNLNAPVYNPNIL